MAKKYCSIYSKMVQGDGDMVGHIAYSLYKAEKVQYINEQKENLKVDVLPEEVVQEFTTGRESKTSIEHYRGMAESILQGFIGGSFDDMSEQVISEVTNRLTQHMDANIKPGLPKKEPGWKKFWSGVLQSMVGTFAMAFVVWGIVTVVSKYSAEKIFPPEGSSLQTEQVAVPPAPADSMVIEEVKPQEVIAPAKNKNTTPSAKK
jgi:hypothetical protein